MVRKPNYDFEKRRKELDRKAKKEEKRADRQQRREEQHAEDTPTEPAAEPGESGSAATPSARTRL